MRKFTLNNEDTEMLKKVEEYLQELENKLGIKKGLFFSLVSLDDWSFIIKLHSLMESAITHLLVNHLNVKKAEKFFSRLELSNVYTGKIALIKQLELLSKSDINYITSLSELRNNLVHNVTNVNFDFSLYLDSLDKKQKDKYFKSFGILIDIEKGKQQQLLQMSLKKPKLFIWSGAMVILLKIYGHNLRLSTERNPTPKEFSGLGMASIAYPPKKTE
jgi:hypothetical protein